MYKVYLISCGNEDNKKYKIGYTRKPVTERVKQLKTGNHEELIVEQVFDSKWGTKIEAVLHRNYRYQKISGEWFELSEDQVGKFLVECQNLEKFFDDLFKNSTFKNPNSILN
jgi:hypothetical protein